MKKKINNAILELTQGDITNQDTEAIVNAANSSLLGGGGVDGAIHRAGGASILEECKKLGGCPTGEAKITTAGNMKASYVIHTVGPIWKGGSRNERDLLKSCYQCSMKIAEDLKISSLSFPSISTGIYRFPIEEASRIALSTVASYLKQSRYIKKCVFVLFSEKDLNIYVKALEEIED